VRVVSADLWEPAPGQVLTWDVTPGAGLVPEPTPITFNQRNHLLGAAHGEPSVWITAAFDVDGPVDVGALEEAFRDLVARHPGLQVEAVRRPPEPAGGVGLVRHDPGTLVWVPRRSGPATLLARLGLHRQRGPGERLEPRLADRQVGELARGVRALADTFERVVRLVQQVTHVVDQRELLFALERARAVVGLVVTGPVA
jgi:hypothetical protein